MLANNLTAAQLEAEILRCRIRVARSEMGRSSESLLRRRCNDTLEQVGRYVSLFTDLRICEGQFGSLKMCHYAANVNISFGAIDCHSPVRHVLELRRQSLPSVWKIWEDDADQETYGNSDSGKS